MENIAKKIADFPGINYSKEQTTPTSQNPNVSSGFGNSQEGASPLFNGSRMAVLTISIFSIGFLGYFVYKKFRG